jgi:hypothetical protein
MRIVWRRVAVAAAICVGAIIGIGILIQTQQQKIETPPAGIVVLKLANGKEIKPGDQGLTVNDEDNNAVLVSDNKHEIVNAQKDQISLTALNTLQIPSGQDFYLLLADGTEVWLNAETELEFPLSFKGAAMRQVKVIGEAYFKVAHNTKQPFTVSTPNGDIRVSGTEFNVKCYTGEQEKTSLVTGKINFSTQNKTFDLSPGQQIEITSDNARIGEFDETEALAWMKGIYYFRNESLSDIKHVLERWYGIKVRLSASVAEKRFSGALEKKKSIDNFLTNIANTSDVQYAYKANILELY